MKNVIALGLVALALSAFPAFASDLGPYGVGPISRGSSAAEQPFSWTGVYVGGGAGYGVGDVEVNVPGLAGIDGLSMHGWQGDGRVGADYQFKGTPFVVGALAGYNFGSADFDLNVAGLGSLLNAKLEKTWYAGGRIGLATKTGTLFYVGAAWTQADFDLSVPVAAGICGPVLSCSNTLDGKMFLAGAETMLSDNFSIAAEYTFTDYDSVNVLKGSPIPVNVSPDEHAFKVRANLRMNWFN